MARRSKGSKFADQVWRLASDMGVEGERTIANALHDCANMVSDKRKNASAAHRFRQLASRFAYQRASGSVVPGTFKKCAKFVAPKVR